MQPGSSAHRNGRDLEEVLQIVSGAVVVLALVAAPWTLFAFGPWQDKSWLFVLGGMGGGFLALMVNIAYDSSFWEDLSPGKGMDWSLRVNVAALFCAL